MSSSIDLIIPLLLTHTQAVASDLKRLAPVGRAVVCVLKVMSAIQVKILARLRPPDWC